MLLTLLSATVLLLGSHYFIHRSVVSACNVTRPRVRLTLLLGFTALAISIPLAMGAAVSLAAVLAFSASLYGLWNANHPVVTSFEVEISELPESWEGRTVVQLSDVHLGSVHGRRFLRHVVETVNALDPEAVFITGDLLNGSSSDLDRFEDLLDALQARLILCSLPECGDRRCSDLVRYAG